MFTTIDQLLDEVLNPQSSTVWQPDPRNKPQCAAYQMAVSGQVMEIGYGGQAGGGKTDLALGLAGTHFKRSLIMRREYPQLDGIIERGNEIYPETLVQGRKMRWSWGDRTITLRSMQHEKDWKKQQGQARDLVVFDEAAEFPEKGLRSVTGWTRALPGQRTLVLYLFNPPTTSEGEWIIQYFAPWIDPDYPNERAQDGEIRWFIHVPKRGNDDQEDIIEVANGDPVPHDGQVYYPISRTFFAASRFDNPYLDEEYERRLNALPEPLRTMVKDGDFTLGRQDNDWQVIPTHWVLAAQKRWEQTVKPSTKLRAVGVDVAHGGADETTIAKLYENWFDVILCYSGEETPEGKDAAQKVELAMESDAVIAVDAIGYGASAAERLADDRKRNVIKVNVGAGSDATDKSGKFRFSNLRSEIHWKLREALDPENGENLCIPPGRGLRAQLCAPRYKLQAGRYAVEPKADIKKRLRRSPDESEAIMLAWYAAQFGGRRPFYTL